MTMISNHSRFRRYQVAMDMWLVVLVIVLVAALALISYSDAVYKAKISEPMTLLGAERGTFIEAFALTGEPPQGILKVPELGAPTGNRSRRIASVRDLAETQQSIARTELMLVEVEGFGKRRVSGGRSTNAIVGLSDGVPTAAVFVSFLERPSLVELRPAMASSDAPVVIWLCGQQRPPEGMVAPSVREPSVPDRFLPSVCRGRV